MPSPWNPSQLATIATNSGLSEADVLSAYSTSNDSAEVKKWKDAFTAAAALWINCEIRNSPYPNPDSPQTVAIDPIHGDSPK